MGDIVRPLFCRTRAARNPSSQSGILPTRARSRHAGLDGLGFQGHSWHIGTRHTTLATSAEHLKPMGPGVIAITIVRSDASGSPPPLGHQSWQSIAAVAAAAAGPPPGPNPLSTSKSTPNTHVRPPSHPPHTSRGLGPVGSSSSSSSSNGGGGEGQARYHGMPTRLAWHGMAHELLLRLFSRVGESLKPCIGSPSPFDISFSTATVQSTSVRIPTYCTPPPPPPPLIQLVFLDTTVQVLGTLDPLSLGEREPLSPSWAPLPVLVLPLALHLFLLLLTSVQSSPDPASTFLRVHGTYPSVLIPPLPNQGARVSRPGWLITTTGILQTRHTLRYMTGACQFQAQQRLPVDRPRHTISRHTLKFIQYMIDPASWDLG
ncbi:hypothetical protein CH63R_04303 [Colletotrichum higginsianum IMI 349063]|uniref:Uncharacterized protein n=1 Tax=Colletotrichum higginsianum (strain IMI 349063) TaxID=759273 RepID=A0A1B7YIV1_COLHI|nr:hypothetical protein CH63R_04303 [Colletotrichum higginsianum IMI 349063]OBR12007.1 hypothetical protein CH63R_04303 [Colletotrichum higginsianum IMI 349063]